MALILLSLPDHNLVLKNNIFSAPDSLPLVSHHFSTFINFQKIYANGIAISESYYVVETIREEEPAAVFSRPYPYLFFSLNQAHLPGV